MKMMVIQKFPLEVRPPGFPLEVRPPGFPLEVVPAGGQAPRVPAGGQAPRVPAGGQASSVPVAVPEYPDEVTKPIGSFMEIIQDVSGLYHDETRKSALKDLYTWEEASVDDSMDSSNSQATLKLL